MERNRSRVISDEDVQRFRERISQYTMSTLGFLYEYFRNDLKHIVEIVDTHYLLSELNERKFPMKQDYLLMKKMLGASIFTDCLLDDVMAMRQDGMLAWWESLYVLQNRYQHPNLIGVLEEFIQKGETLVPLIILDKDGHQLHLLKEFQISHKKHLMEITGKLQEHNAPGLVQPGQSCNISSCYLDLVVVSTPEFRNRSQHEIIDTGGIHEHYMREAHIALERISPNRLFRWHHRSGCIPHAVMVSGVPGVGKTTLMQKFVYDWVFERHYQRFSFVFFFKFRELNSYKEISLDEMIYRQYSHLHSHLDIILKEPEKLLFIFDGLDESIHNIDFGLENVCSNTKERVRLGVIVVSLVRQSLLKGSSLLFTSRPTKLASVDISGFQRVCEIVGFFPKERKMYFQQFFQDQRLSKEAFKYVRQNDTLYTFCYIPSYCWIMCKVLSVCFKVPGPNQFLPKTVTQLFVSYVANILANHCTGTENSVELMTSMGRMAQHGVMNHILYFNSKDFECFQVNSRSQFLSSFMIEDYQSESQSTTYSFLHLTIQEFFSAFHHYLKFSETEMQSSLQRVRSMKDGCGEMFIRFLCGLSDGTTTALLKPYLSPETSPSKMVISWLCQEMKDKWRPKIDSREKMSLLIYLFESRNKALVFNTIGPHRELDFSDFHLTPVDCTILAFILESCTETNSLNLDRCFIQGEGLERLSRILHTVRDLRLSNNDLKDSDMEFIFKVLNHESSRVQRLSLRNNSLTSCSSLACSISLNHNLTELDLSFNNLAGPDFHDLMDALSLPTCTISRLSLREIKLKDENVSLLKSLSKTPNLRYLDLSSSNLSDISAQYLQDLILDSPNLEEIRLGLNSFSRQKEEFLKQLQALKPGLSVIF